MTSLHEYTSHEVCPICGKSGWCARREDGLVLCKRAPSPPEVPGYTFKGMTKDGTTGMYVEGGRESPVRNRLPRQRASKAIELGRGESPLLDEGRSPEIIFRSWVGAFTPERRAALSQELGLPEYAIGRLIIGWSESARHHDDYRIAGAWVFPECDGQGRIIGISYRFPHSTIQTKTRTDGKPIGSKSAPAGFRRGLTLPDDWREMPDPIYAVEGPSDVLAGRALGLSVIGRPSNCGGTGYIAQAFRFRRVIILGENDRKNDGRWPGKEGAELIPRKLASI